MVVFSSEDITFFELNGYISCSGVFSKETAEECRKVLDVVLKDDGVDVHNKSTWVQRKGLNKVYYASDNYPWHNVFTSRLKEAVDELCGHGSWLEFGCGWWVITFPDICTPPWFVDGHWHVDGSWHTHYPYSKEIGIVPVMLFSDILPEGGGTAVSKGSHKFVTDILIDCGLRGCRGPDIAKIAMDYGFNQYEVVELTGQAGDVIFLHPHLLHARSTNLGKNGVHSIRYMCHPSVMLKSHMNFNMPLADMTPVMRAMVKNPDLFGSESNLELLQYITPEAVESFNNRSKCKGKKRRFSHSEQSYSNVDQGYDPGHGEAVGIIELPSKIIKTTTSTDVIVVKENVVIQTSGTEQTGEVDAALTDDNEHDFAHEDHNDNEDIEAAVGFASFSSSKY